MSFFSDASLVYVPSGVKDAKTYSIKPTDGSGDLTFSRGSDIEVTRVNSQGLIEKAKVNLLLQSGDFSNVAWSVTRNQITAGATTAPDGTTTADKTEANSTFVANSSRVYQAVSVSGVNTVSIYAKAGEITEMLLYAIGANDGIYFNLSTGSFVAYYNNLNIISYDIVSAGSGWYRYSITFDTAITRFEVYLSKSGNYVANYTLGEGFYIWHPQVNYGLVAQDYVETTTAAVVTGITNDMPRLNYDPANPTCPSLLLEPSRQNLYSYSEYAGGFGTSNTGVSIEENATTSPEGVVNAAKIKEDGTNGSHAVRQLTGPTLTSGTEYTFSFFAKKGERTIVALSNTVGASNDVNCFFDLENGQVLTNTFNSASIEDFGNGWWRCIATDTADAADDYDTRIYTATADNQFTHQGVSGSGLYIFGIQLEAGSYPTSYIPTYGTSATRTADACSKTSIASLFNDSEGTFFAEIQAVGVDSATKVITIGDGSSLNRVQIFYQAGTNITTNVISGGTSQVTGFTTTFDQSQNAKVIIRYANNNAKFFLNGVEIASDTSVTTPTGLSGIYFNNGTGAADFLGLVKQLVYIPSALSDADCITLTT